MTQIEDISKTTFYEKINSTKLRFIINNKDLCINIIEQQEKAMRRNKGNISNISPFTLFKKNIERFNPYS